MKELIPTEQVLKELNRNLKVAQDYPHFKGENSIDIKETSACMIRNQMIKRDEMIKKLLEAVTLALVTLEDNNLMNDRYRQIHAILDGE